MNRRRKSDKSVVSKKPSNKANNMVAERVERRDLPKENKQQQNMLRTQRREGVLNELLLIHQKAIWCYYLREEPYALILHVRICAGDDR